jgi:hypothetical protein
MDVDAILKSCFECNDNVYINNIDVLKIVEILSHHSEFFEAQIDLLEIISFE